MQTTTPTTPSAFRARLREFWFWTKISLMLSIAPILGGLYCAHAMGS